MLALDTTLSCSFSQFSTKPNAWGGRMPGTATTGARVSAVPTMTPPGPTLWRALQPA